MYDYKYIRVEQPEPGIAVMSFIRPEKLNSWSREVFNDMLHFFRLLKTDDETKVLIIRGEGDRAFCTGADFNSLFPNEGDRDSVEKSFEFQEQLRELIVLVHEVKFSCPLLKMSMSCGDLGCAYMLPRLIGDGVARDILLTGRYMFAGEAMSLGYASGCYPLSELDNAAMEKARVLAGYSAEALRYSKQLLNMMESVGNLDTAIKIENRNQQLVKAFNKEKRNK